MTVAPLRLGPFSSAQEAWIWTMRSLQAARAARPYPAGPCEPHVVVGQLDALYRHRRIELDDVHVLRKWGLNGYAPPLHNRDRRAWDIALGALEPRLRRLGIVA